MLIPGVSSITKADSPRITVLSVRSRHSWSSSCPVRIFCESTWEFMEIKRFASCTRDISRLNITVVMLFLIATFSAIFNTNAVFPIEGRAAIKIRSDFCNPAVRASRS